MDKTVKLSCARELLWPYYLCTRMQSPGLVGSLPGTLGSMKHVACPVSIQPHPTHPSAVAAVIPAPALPEISLTPTHYLLAPAYVRLLHVGPDPRSFLHSC